MLTLGIETSGGEGTIALVRDQNVLAAETVPQQGRRHAQMLVPAILQLLKQNGIDFSELELIGVSLGPGSFTGLRVGIVCAKTLAYTLSCPVKGVMTFDVIAKNISQPNTEQPQNLAVIADAQRGEVFIANYQSSEGRWNRQADVQIRNVEQWTADLESDCLVTGPVLNRYQDLLGQVESVKIADERHWQPHAVNVAQLATEQYQSDTNSQDDPFSLQPFYLRPSAAEEKWNARQVQGE